MWYVVVTILKMTLFNYGTGYLYTPVNFLTQTFEKTYRCWNSNSSTTSNTLYVIWTPSAQQAHQTFV